MKCEQKESSYRYKHVVNTLRWAISRKHVANTQTIRCTRGSHVAWARNRTHVAYTLRGTEVESTWHTRGKHMETLDGGKHVANTWPRQARGNTCFVPEPAVYTLLTCNDRFETAHLKEWDVKYQPITNCKIFLKGKVLDLTQITNICKKYTYIMTFVYIISRLV